MKHIILFVPLLLSGCMGIYEGGFECPPSEGTKCKSISEVNELVNRNQETRKQQSSCPVNTDDCPCISPLPLIPVPPTPEIWWAPEKGGYVL